MHHKNEKLAFSQRLKQQLMKRGWTSNSPTWLAKEFNLRYHGQSISIQTASNWLTGMSIPNQDKLQVLSAWLDVSSQWLRFGEIDTITHNNSHLQQERAPDYPNMHFQIDDLLDKLSLLSSHQKYLVYMLINELLKK